MCVSLVDWLLEYDDFVVVVVVVVVFWYDDFEVDCEWWVVWFFVVDWCEVCVGCWWFVVYWYFEMDFVVVGI